MITKLATEVIALCKCYEAIYEALSQTRSSFPYTECGSQSLPKQQPDILGKQR